MVRVDAKARICRVRVVTGAALALLDTTGTLTTKYQARCLAGVSAQELFTPVDTERLLPILRSGAAIGRHRPVDEPDVSSLLPIDELFRKLAGLIGQSFINAGSNQERLRGEALHRLVAGQLGYLGYKDNGQFPDIRHQLMEVKLQMSPTIDLGLVPPSSEELLDVSMIEGRQIRHCDVRYAVFVAAPIGVRVALTHLILTTGMSFFRRFPPFGGHGVNTKLQIPLPRGFFDG